MTELAGTLPFGLVFDVYLSANLHVVARLVDPDAAVCVAFASGGAARDASGLEMAARHGFNWIAVSSRQMEWFQYPDLPEAEAAIRAVTRRFPRVVTYGFSQGGFGALICSGPLDADLVLACSAQAGIGPFAPPGESRWSEAWALVGASLGFPHADLAARLTRRGEVLMLYDQRDRDSAHVALVEALRPVRRLHFPLAGHATLHRLTAVGLGSTLVREVLGGAFDPADFQRRLHAARRGGIRGQALVSAMLRRGRTVPPALLRRLAGEAKPERPVLRRAALHAAARGLATETGALVAALLDQPGYAQDRGLARDFEAFAPTLARSADVVADLRERLRGLAEETKQGDPGARILVAAARIEHAAGEAAEARRLADAAAVLLGAWNDANRDLAMLFDSLGAEAEAATYWRRTALAAVPDFALHEQLARQAERDTDWPAAARIWTEARDRGVDPPRVATRLSRALARQDRVEEALAALAPALAVDVPALAVLRTQADLLARLGRQEAAVEVYRHIVADAPRDAGTHRALSNLLAAMRRPEEALAHARLAVAHAPEQESHRRHLERMLAQAADQSPSNNSVDR